MDFGVATTRRGQALPPKLSRSLALGGLSKTKSRSQPPRNLDHLRVSQRAQALSQPDHRHGLHLLQMKCPGLEKGLCNRQLPRETTQGGGVRDDGDQHQVITRGVIGQKQTWPHFGGSTHHTSPRRGTGIVGLQLVKLLESLVGSVGAGFQFVPARGELEKSARDGLTLAGRELRQFGEYFP